MTENDGEKCANSPIITVDKAKFEYRSYVQFGGHDMSETLAVNGDTIYTTESWDECAQACLNHQPKCKGFSWVKNDAAKYGDRKKCFLKWNTEVSKNDTKYISGVLIEGNDPADDPVDDPVEDPDDVILIENCAKVGTRLDFKKLNLFSEFYLSNSRNHFIHGNFVYGDHWSQTRYDDHT